MTVRAAGIMLLGMVSLFSSIRLAGKPPVQDAATPDPHKAHAGGHVAFRTSDRCVACHNGMQTSSGEDVSIGLAWRASLMANSSRDPYWQGSVRRETLDHPESKASVEDDCSGCHMPAIHLSDQSEGRITQILSRLPLKTEARDGYAPETDGVTCSVCHQIEKTGLGTQQTFNGNVVIAKTTDKEQRIEYGPYVPDNGHQRLMVSSTREYLPKEGDQMRDSALCGSCHTLYTKALGPGGKQVGILPEQVPYQEWHHSDYATRQNCQSCHMPEVTEPVAITALYGQRREGLHRHVFVGGNFLLEGMFRDHGKDLSANASPEEFSAAVDRTRQFLGTQAARLTIPSIEQTSDGLAFHVLAQNMTGHKLPTAYPARRVWLHVTVRDKDGRAIFESGALQPDGSIAGNDNDGDPSRFEPHYREITREDQVEIFEPILKDIDGKVTTGLLAAVDYAKDNRLLPSGFSKQTAPKEIAVVGDAAADPQFTDQGATIAYRIQTQHASGPFQVRAELWYQPVGYRWAHNLEPYQEAEPQKFVKYYEQSSHDSAQLLAAAEVTR